MREIQSRILSRLDEARSQEDVERVAKEETDRVKQEILQSLGIMERTLGALPLELMKR